VATAAASNSYQPDHSSTPMFTVSGELFPSAKEGKGNSINSSG
jgi:hypothetical protein